MLIVRFFITLKIKQFLVDMTLLNDKLEYLSMLNSPPKTNAGKLGKARGNLVNMTRREQR